MILGGLGIRRAFGNDGPWQAWRDGLKIGVDQMKIGANSIDVSLADEYIVTWPTALDGVVDPTDPGSLGWEKRKISDEVDKCIVLSAGGSFLGATRERFAVDPSLDYFGRYGLSNLEFKTDIDGISTMGRLFIICHATAGYGDFGFDGDWTLEICNLNYYAVRLYPLMRIAQVSFQAVLEPDKYDGAYLFQSGPKIPVLSKERCFPPCHEVRATTP